MKGGSDALKTANEGLLFDRDMMGKKVGELRETALRFKRQNTRKTATIEGLEKELDSCAGENTALQRKIDDLLSEGGGWSL